MGWSLMKNYYTSNADNYKGVAERCTFEFEYQAEWFGSQDGVQQQINACVQSVVEHGGIPLQVTIYRDQSPVWTTKYQVIVTAYDPTADYTPSSGTSGVDGIGIAPVLIFLAWAGVAGIVAIIFYILSISVAKLIMAFSNVDFGGVAKTITASMWWILAIAGVFLVGGLLTASGRKRYSEAGEWVRSRGKTKEISDGGD